jgi:hypothetical protein
LVDKKEDIAAFENYSADVPTKSAPAPPKVESQAQK